jgi:DNA-binding beta-propeller fold protein YncE
VHQLSTSGDQLASWGGFGDPYGLTVASDGTLYVADTDNGRVVALSASGEVLNTRGSEGAAIGEFKFPEAVAVDDSGTLYVADRGNDRVQVLR